MHEQPKTIIKPVWSTEPQLMLETGMHTSNIRRIDVDRKGEWLVTASEDKTIRLWNLNYEFDEPVRIFRVPSDDRNDGKIYAVAISPDARLIAAGGVTKLGSETGYTIYIFDRVSGRMINSIKELPASILHLEFSPDGTRLAASLNNAKGVMIFSSKDFTELFRDEDYDDASYGLAYAKDGRLAAVSLDGYVRIYDSNHHLLVKKKMTGDRKSPCSVAFSPDGRKVAVGYFNHGANILFSVNLEEAQNIDYSGLSGDDSHDSVAFSADGRYLYAGCGYSKQGSRFPVFQIRRWDLRNGGYTEEAVAINTITQIKPLPNGKMIFCSSSPSFGLIADMNVLYERKFEQQETRRSELYASNDGSVFSLVTTYDSIAATVAGLKPLYQTSEPFSIVDRDFVRSNKTSLNPRNRKEGVYWDDHYTSDPKLKGVDVTLDEGEKAVSAVACLNNDCVLVGSSWYLRLVDGHGGLIWKISTKSEPWAVTITRDSRYAIAAFDDGTFRWYGMADGKEILAYFTNLNKLSNGREWVMWTPEGYFDASPGGAQIIGYHLNQGRGREAAFIPLNYLYDVFYRPDIVQAKFRGEDISNLITLTASEALKNPPPVVKLTSYPYGSSNASSKVCYEVTSTGGGIGEVRLFQNGKLIKSDGFYREAVVRDNGEQMQLGANSRAIYDDMRSIVVKEKKMIDPRKPKGEQYEECVDIEAIPGENEISVVAFNATNTVQSALENVTFTSSRKPEEPHLYILAIGNDRYRTLSAKLKYAAKDAKDFAQTLSPKAATLYKTKNIHVTVLENAGKEKILAEIGKLQSKVKDGDGFILFVASHGALVQNQYYIVTSDYNGKFEVSTLLSTNEIVDISKRIKSLSQLFIFDTCHAGGVDAIINGLYDARMSVMARKMGLHIYASAGSLQSAMDGYQGNGLYTYTLLRGINNGSEVDKGKNGKVTIKSLGLYSKEKTTEISNQLGQPQMPLIINFGRDNPLFAVQ